MLNFQELFVKITNDFNAAIKSAKHSFRTASVATIGELGFPEVRTMVLRKFNPDNKSLSFHSDYRSNKVKHIAKNPHIQILFYDKPNKLQLRITAKAFVHYNNEVTLSAWNLMEDSPKKCYSYMSKPGELLECKTLPLRLSSQESYVNFCIIECNISTIDYLSLASSGHQRFLLTFEGDDAFSIQSIMP